VRHCCVHFFTGLSQRSREVKSDTTLLLAPMGALAVILQIYLHTQVVLRTVLSRTDFWKSVFFSRVPQTA
jgi:hypothetical protein